MKLLQAVITSDREFSINIICSCKHKNILMNDEKIIDIIKKAREEKVFDFEIEDNNNKRLRILLIQKHEEKQGTLKVKLENSERVKFSKDQEVGHLKLVYTNNEIHCFTEAYA